jgi:hypothetical protein
MTRGRPLKSEIREKVTAILDVLKFSYGYEIYKHYKTLYNDATSRVIYYHLKKGSEKGEFVTVNVERVVGSFSWGNESERIYYSLGPFAKTSKEWLNKAINLNLKPRKISYDWNKEIKNKIKELKSDVKKFKGKNNNKIINKCDMLINWVEDKNNKSEIINQIKSIKESLK